MKNSILATALGLCLMIPASADDLADRYFSSDSVVLTPHEKAAIAIARNQDANSVRPVPGANGAIRVIYGGPTRIVCAVFQVCDVALQAGERVNGINLGDSARWTVEPAISGSGTLEIQHLIIKPLDVGLDTSLLVTTDRRTYAFKLRSTRSEYMPQVVFTYPEEALAKWEAIRSHDIKERQDKTIPQTGEYLGDLTFNYDIDGSVSWKPLRVFNDGKKTIIEMPKAMQQTEAPSLLVIRKEGGIFRDDDTVMVNYRIQGDRYIVDTVFDKAILIAGVGGNQDRVTITRKR